ncbi:MAG: hypothetical protein JWN40_3802 [Phycisphaerales bacterium]|nr:hypothetical protein [Phycisphaerales bacterium]
MKHLTLPAVAALLLSLIAHQSFALSQALHEPAIFFPKSFDAQKAALITAALSDKQFKFKEGLTSYWEPKFSTTLTYEGDTPALNALLARLAQIKGLRLAVNFSKDLAKETHGFPPAGNWWVEYDHTAPDTLTLRINLAAQDIHLDQLKLPPSTGG